MVEVPLRVATAVAGVVLLAAPAAGVTSGDGAVRPWLVYVTTAPLPAGYGCADLPNRLSRLQVWPGGPLPAAGRIASDPAWSRAGDRIAFSSGDLVCTNGDGIGQSTARIWVVDASGRNRRAITAGASLDRSPSWSPDGSRIAFARFDVASGTGGIYVVGADGRNLTRLSGRTAISLDWSPDGRSIAFVPGQRGVFGYSAAARVAVLDLGSRRVRTFDVPGPDGVRWSPDGRTIAVTGDRAISLLDLRGRPVRRITVGRPGRLAVDGVAWAPDGRRLAYGYGGAIFTVGLDGRRPARIVAGTAPDWRS